MIERFTQLIGQPINSPDLKYFIEQNGGRYPQNDKRQNMSIESLDEAYIPLESLGISLSFLSVRWNPAYPLLPSDIEGEYYYRLSKISFNTLKGEMLMLDYLNISKKIDLDSLKSKLGDPIDKRSFQGRDIYTWDILIDKERDIIIELVYDNNEISCATIEIPRRPIFVSMPDKDILKMIGLPITSPDVRTFISMHGGCYPTDMELKRAKKDGSSYSIHLSSIHACMTFDFSEVTLGVEDKDVYPSLSKISFNDIMETIDIKGILHLPMGITNKDSIDTIIAKWGKPQVKQSNIIKENKVYKWQLPIDDNNFIMNVSFTVSANWGPNSKFADCLDLGLNTRTSL